MVTTKKPKYLLAPLPVALVTVRQNKDNIIALSWVGIQENKPPMLNLNISKGKYSGNIIKETKQFGLCIPRAENIKEIDICGTTHGDKEDKFALTGFTKLNASEIDAPLIKECPIRMECFLEKVIPFNTHEMFIAKIACTHIDDEFYKDGEPDFEKINILGYVNGQYWTMGKKLNNLFFTKRK